MFDCRSRAEENVLRRAYFSFLDKVTSKDVIL